MTTKRTNPDFLNGVPELLILSLLARRPMYGYELVQAIRHPPREPWNLARAASIRFSIGWRRRGCLGSKRETVAGRSRVIYRVTAKGSKHFASTATAWQQIVQAVNHALQGGEHGEPALAR